MVAERTSMIIYGDRPATKESDDKEEDDGTTR
jgi:hypothetical protein